MGNNVSVVEWNSVHHHQDQDQVKLIEMTIPYNNNVKNSQ